MIKFQPFIAPVFAGYKYVTSSLVFDSIPEAELVEDQNIYMYRLLAKWRDEHFSCVFFIDPNTLPQVANVSPAYIVQYGVLMFPEQYEGIVFDFDNVELTVKVQFNINVVNEASPAIDELLKEIEAMVAEPDIDVSAEMIQLMGEYAKIENDKSIQPAYQCVKLIDKMRSVTADELEMISSLPCGSSKLSAFVLGKLKTKVN